MIGSIHITYRGKEGKKEKKREKFGQKSSQYQLINQPSKRAKSGRFPGAVGSKSYFGGRGILTFCFLFSDIRC